MGVSDGTAAAANESIQSVEDTLQWYSLKKQRDSRVSGISFEKFQSLKQEGVFNQSYKALEDSYLQNLFLQ